MATINQDFNEANAAIESSNQALSDLEKQIIELQNYENSIVVPTPNVNTIPVAANTDVYYLYSERGVVNVASSNGGITFPTGNTLNRPSSPDRGTVRYNEQTETLEIYTGNWEDVGSGIGGGGGGAVQGIFYENSQEITANYTSANGKNIVSAGPLNLTLESVTVTIANGSVWTIV